MSVVPLNVEVEVDLRLAEIWAQAAEVSEWTLELVGRFLRAAYGRGYVDAMREEKSGERGKLIRDTGYRLR